MQQSTSKIFMVRPAHFAFNEQTSASNSFQNIPQNISDIQSKVLAEFDAAVAAFRGVGVEVWVVNDSSEVIRPDAIFPNNWISTHQDGTIVLYPMLTLNRRAERRMDIVANLQANNEVKRVLDLSHFESSNIFLEGTGSIVFDHTARTAFACLSPRTHLALFNQLCSELGYRAISFTSVDQLGQAIYHTNVIMGIGDKYAVICLESIKNLEEKNLVIETLNNSGKEIIDISFSQVQSFAGNVLALKSFENKSYLAMSSSAYNVLSNNQKVTIEKFAIILPISIPTIESIGGGSVRCMLAQNFLKKNKAI